MPFLTEPEPERGAVLPVMPGISRIVAANPGPMTYYGTNTYLIDTPDGIAVLDPGPEEHPEHVEAILRATGPNVALMHCPVPSGCALVSPPVMTRSPASSGGNSRSRVKVSPVSQTGPTTSQATNGPGRSLTGRMS